MPIDPINEQLITLRDAAKLFPRERIHVSAMYRYASKGCRGIVLETVQTPSGKATSAEAVARFLEQLTRRAKASLDSPNGRSEQRRRAIEQAERALLARGI